MSVLTILHGDALSQLRQLPGDSIQCCVTSPPYWGLRDYGLEPIVWDETVECEHEWGVTFNLSRSRPDRSTGRKDHNGSGKFVDDIPRGTQESKNARGAALTAGTFCVICGAWRGSFGLEPTPELYIQHAVQIFREVRRVLRGDGTLWLNLGDSYAGGGNGGGGSFAKDGIRAPKPGSNKNVPGRTGSRGVTVKSKRIPRGSGRWGGGNLPAVGDLKPKDLIGIPWRVALALQVDGWWLRRDIIWNKPNPMPESVADRPTTSHEYVFLLTKSARYYYDADAIKEPTQSGPSDIRKMNQRLPRIGGKTLTSTDPLYKANKTTNIGKVRAVGSPDGRNARSVWTIATAPFRDAHFATFPPELPRRCILAGCMGGGTVLDPFAGSGTTAKVAIELGRKSVLIEPNSAYIEMIKRRTNTTLGIPLSA